MPITINGNGSITGLSVGGLPNGTVTDATIAGMAASKLTGALPAISGANLTGISAGITEADQWRITQGYNVSYTSSDANSYWERNDRHYDKIGSGMTESSGVFTFPVTGIWLVSWNVMYENGNSNYLGGSINGSTDGFSSSNDVLVNAYNSIGSGANSYASVYMQAIFDVTNVSTHKIKFRHINSHNAYVQHGSSNTQLTGGTFIKLGDT